MNNKLIIFLFMIGVTFGYTVYEAKKLESILSTSHTSATGTVIQAVPSKLKLQDFHTQKYFDLNSLTSSSNNIVVHFWATWCGPCEIEFPELIKLTKHMKSQKDLKFIFIAVNDDLKKVSKFLSKFEVEDSNTVLLIDNNGDFKKFGSYKLPETFVFDKGSQIIKKFTGQQVWTQKHIIKFFETL